MTLLPLSHRSAFAQAERLWYAADYDACLDILDAVRPTPQGTILRGRALIRMEQYEQAKELLPVDGPLDGPLESERLAVLAFACVHLGDFSTADDAIFRANALAKCERDQAMCAYYGAVIFWARGDYDSAGRLIATIPRSVGDYFAHGLNLRAWIASNRGDYLEAAGLFRVALGRFLSAETRDNFIIAAILWPLALLARDLYLEGLLPVLSAAYDSIKWTPWLSVPRFHYLRNIAWTRAAAGDFPAAFRRLRESRAIAPSAPWTVLALCDRANLYLSIKEVSAANDSLAEAIEIANEIPWMQFSGEERTALLHLANLLSSKDSVAARGFLETYRALGKTSPVDSYGQDIRNRALEHFAFGSVEHGAKNILEASHHYAEALKIYRKIGFEWRAVLVCAARAEIMQNRHNTEGVLAGLERFPNSWLKSLVEQRLTHPAESEAEQIHLTPTQVEILKAVCDGKSDKQIAAETGRSIQTVKEHLIALRKATGTSSRTSLAVFATSHNLT